MERNRIEKAGGSITVPSSPSGGSSRIICPSSTKDNNDDNAAFGLAMSRSLGDKACKNIGLIAEPTIDVIDLDQIIIREESNNKNNNQQNKIIDGIFTVSASDGIFDKVQPMFVANHLAKSLYSYNQKHQHDEKQEQRQRQPTLLEACEQLIMKSSYSWISQSIPYRDDITIAVAKINI